MAHKYFNSIITSHKGRPGSVHAFLRAIFLASRRVDKDSFEVVIADLDRSKKVDRKIASYADRLNIKHLKVDYDGVFWKSKALNYCALNTKGKYITMLDIDAVVPPLFFEEMKRFYKDPAHQNTKLCYRVRFLDTRSSKTATKHDFEEDFVNGLIVQHRKFRQAFERFTKNEVKLRKMNAPQKKWLFGQTLGNSHYTMRKEDFMAIGGYDERFIGWACEDLDFNRRAFAYLNNGDLNPAPAFTVFSVHHNRSGWMSKKWTMRNEKLYNKNKKEGLIQLPIGEKWGKF